VGSPPCEPHPKLLPQETRNKVNFSAEIAVRATLFADIQVVAEMPALRGENTFCAVFEICEK
jgi:hypothetical protein